MLNVPENELFSAYLDGELTAEEQAQMEQLLDASPAARQLMDELRSLGANLQSLSVYQLKEDLSARVLRRAEQQVLSGTADLAPQRDPPIDNHPSTKGPTILRRLLRPRNLVWSAAAVAVALVLMVLDRGLLDDPRDGDQIAAKPDRSVHQVAPAPGVGPTIPQARASEDPDSLEKPGSLEKPSSLEKPGPADRPSPAGSESSLADLKTIARDPADHRLGPAEATPDNLPADPAESPQSVHRRERLLVVRCDVHVEAAGKQVLGEILTKRKIPRLEANDRATGKTYIEVELTPTQMRAVVADLKARPQAFAGVSAPPTPGTAGPRIPSAARSVGGIKRPIQAAAGSAASVNTTVKKNGLASPNASARRSTAPISPRLQRIEVQIGGKGRAVVSAGGKPTKPGVQGKVEGRAIPSRNEPKIRVRFEFKVVQLPTEVEQKESD